MTLASSSLYEVRKTSFNDYLANGGSSVQERWLGPASPILEHEKEETAGEERDGPEHEENEGGCGDQLYGHEGEDTQGKDTSHKLLTGLLLIRQWLRYCWQKWWKPCHAQSTASI